MSSLLNQRKAKVEDKLKALYERKIDLESTLESIKLEIRLSEATKAELMKVIEEGDFIFPINPAEKYR